jgi:hypothetical protein
MFAKMGWKMRGKQSDGSCSYCRSGNPSHMEPLRAETANSWIKRRESLAVFSEARWTRRDERVEITHRIFEVSMATAAINFFNVFFMFFSFWVETKREIKQSKDRINYRID